MQTQAPKLGSILIAVAFAFVAVCVAIFFWKAFGGSTPLSPAGYRIDASFPQAASLYPNADVRVSGVNVGKVVGVSQAGQRTRAVMEIDDDYAPVADDASAILRTKTLLGETYVELTPGSPNAPRLPDGGHLATKRIAATQRLDQVLATFNGPTRRSLKRLLVELAAATHGRGGDLNAALGQAPSAVGNLATVVGVLDRERASVHELVAASAHVLEGLGTRQAELRTLVTAGDRVLSATAARGRSLTATVRALPGFLAQTRRTLAAYRRTAAALPPSLAKLRGLAPALGRSLDATADLAPKLAGFFRQLPGVMEAARTGLPAATRTLRAAGPLADALYPAGRQLEPFYRLAKRYRRDIAAAVAKGAAATNATTAGPGGTRLHYLRVMLPLVNEGYFGFGERLPTNRHNPYPRPGALTDYLHGGLRAFDCDNASNPLAVPPLGVGAGPPPCRVQGRWSFLGHRRAFPHPTRAR